jgi:hypothetical protein
MLTLKRVSASLAAWANSTLQAKVDAVIARLDAEDDALKAAKTRKSTI